jgi:acetyltransferase-like isoleucine patch superfamily enzyme
LHSQVELTIAIPTFNRSAMLDRCLTSLVTQEIFREHDLIEIVISDNASTDDTESVARRYIEKFPEKIAYFRNDENVGDRNFKLCLERSSGDFVKFSNDTLEWLPNSLELLVKNVRSLCGVKPILFFTNISRADPVVVTENLNDFLLNLSFRPTWIGGFGMWRDDFRKFPDMDRFVDTNLSQFDAVLRRLEASGSAVIFNYPFCTIQRPKERKGNYSLSQVFGANYLRILRNFSGSLGRGTYEFLKKDVLINHILPSYFDPEMNFGLQNLMEGLDDYLDEPYLFGAIAEARNNHANFKKNLKPEDVTRTWRNRNGHNETRLSRICDFRKISVGLHTYGDLDVWDWGASNERLVIGSYVSIAYGVRFLLGGEHRHRGITNFPVRVKFQGHAEEAVSRGPIIIGDDVWIGQNVTILSGVKIGQGAVIGAGSIVTSDVPDYAIACGVPARVKKYRFEPKIRAKLSLLDYSRVSADLLSNLSEEFGDSVDDARLEEFFIQNADIFSREIPRN